MLYIQTSLHITKYTRSNIKLEDGFPDVLDLANISYYLSIRDILNSRTMNSDTFSYIIYVRLGYLVNHVVSSKFVVLIAHLFLYSIILNDPLIVSMIVMV